MLLDEYIAALQEISKAHGGDIPVVIGNRPVKPPVVTTDQRVTYIMDCFQMVSDIAVKVAD